MHSANPQHYHLLDDLRGIAAIIVVCYHVFEGFSFAEITNQAGDGMIKVFNHGYLAVDFFFLLSGFVLNHAYANRWNEINITTFFQRRLIRLHPMLIVGSLLGEMAAAVPGLGWLAYGKSFGLTEPFLLDINILQVSFGMTVQLNIAGIIGIIIDTCNKQKCDYSNNRNKYRVKNLTFEFILNG